MDIFSKDEKLTPADSRNSDFSDEFFSTDESAEDETQESVLTRPAIAGTFKGIFTKAFKSFKTQNLSK